MSKYLYFIIVVLTLFPSCNKSNDDESSDEAVFRATINGELWEADVLSSTNGIYQVAQFNEQGLQVQGDSNGIRLRVSIAEDRISDCMSVGNYAFPNRVDISYDNGQGTNNYIGGHFYVEDTQGMPIMTLRITSCSDNKISGEFSGTYVGDSGPNSPTDIEITDGVFENIEFGIFQL